MQIPPRPPGRVAPLTLSRKRMRTEQLRDVRLNGERPLPAPVEHPATRGDCQGGPRPCPLVGCRHHIAIEVQPNGSIVVGYPDRPVEEMTASCSLDVADQGPVTLEQVGALLNLTRERIRQIEAEALLKLAAAVDPQEPDHV